MSCCRRQYAGTRPWSLNNAYERGTRCRRRAIAPPRGRRQLGIRAGACPVAAANPSALAPCPSITIHTSYVYHTHVLQILCQCTRPPPTMTGNTCRCMSCCQRQCACTCPSSLNKTTFLPYNDTYVASTVPMHQPPVDDDWECLPGHVLLPAPMRLYLPLALQ